METITMEADLTDQIKGAVKKLEAEEQKLSALRSLLQAAANQLKGKDEGIKHLAEEVETLKNRMQQG